MPSLPKKRLRTSVDNAVLVTVVERTTDLARELACNTFPQPSMTDDVVEHLPAADVLEHHVVVVLVDDHLPHPTDVRVVQQHRERSLAQRPYLLRGVLGRLLRRCLRRRPAACPTGSHSGEDFDRELDPRYPALHSRETENTEGGCSPSPQ